MDGEFWIGECTKKNQVVSVPSNFNTAAISLINAFQIPFHAQKGNTLVFIYPCVQYTGVSWLKQDISIDHYCSLGKALLGPTLSVCLCISHDTAASVNHVRCGALNTNRHDIGSSTEPSRTAELYKLWQLFQKVLGHLCTTAEAAAAFSFSRWRKDEQM